MPVQAQTRVNRSTGNGVTTVFPYTFRVLSKTHIRVTVDGTVQTVDTDYTVSGVGDAGGGDVTFTTAPANATAVVLSGSAPYSRSTDYVRNGSFQEETVDADFDLAVILIQQLDERAGRALTIPIDDATGTDVELPAAADRASMYLAFDAEGNVVVTAGTTSAYVVTPFAETLLDDLTAAAARATLEAVPQGSSTGGNARGTAAVDLQTTRAAVTQVARGNYSAVGGGRNNTASATYATVAGGSTSTASAQSSTVGGGVSNTASGLSSTVSGGDGNTASGSNATVVGGNRCTASGTYAVAGGLASTASGSNSTAFSGGTASASTSVAMGANCTANAINSMATGSAASVNSIYGKSVRAVGSLSGNAGNAQRGETILLAATTDATPEALTADQAAAGVTNQLVLGNNQAMIVRGQVLCRQSVAQADKVSGWEFTAVIRRGANAAATALAAAVTPTLIAQDATLAATVLAVTADTTNGALAVTVTGIAATNLYWMATLHSTELVYA